MVQICAFLFSKFFQNCMHDTSFHNYYRTQQCMATSLRSTVYEKWMNRLCLMGTEWAVADSLTSHWLALLVFNTFAELKGRKLTFAVYCCSKFVLYSVCKCLVLVHCYKHSPLIALWRCFVCWAKHISKLCHKVIYCRSQQNASHIITITTAQQSAHVTW